MFQFLCLKSWKKDPRGEENSPIHPFFLFYLCICTSLLAHLPVPKQTSRTVCSTGKTKKQSSLRRMAALGLQNRSVGSSAKLERDGKVLSLSENLLNKEISPPGFLYKIRFNSAKDKFAAITLF